MHLRRFGGMRKENLSCGFFQHEKTSYKTSRNFTGEKTHYVFVSFRRNRRDSRKCGFCIMIARRFGAGCVDENITPTNIYSDREFRDKRYGSEREKQCNSKFDIFTTKIKFHAMRPLDTRRQSALAPGVLACHYCYYYIASSHYARSPHPFLRAKYSRLSRYMSEHVLFSLPLSHLPFSDLAQCFHRVLGNRKILVFERRSGRQNKRLKDNEKISFANNPYARIWKINIGGPPYSTWKISASLCLM